MSLATLRAVQQQLRLTVEAAQFHLEVAADFDSRQDDADQAEALAQEIESLQAELQSVLATVLTNSRLKPATSFPQAAALEQADEALAMAAETEEEPPEREPQDPKPSGWQAKPREELPAALQNFVQATGPVLEPSHTAAQKTRLACVAMGKCRVVTSQLVVLMESGGCLDEPSACLFRVTVERLAEAVAEPTISLAVSIRTVALVVAELGKVLELANVVLGTPAALASAELRSSRLKFKKNAEEHMDDGLINMHTFVQAVEKQKKPLAGDSLSRAVKNLAGSLRQDIVVYNRCQEMGLPDRSEKRWALFTKVASALGDWIGRTNMPATPSKELKRMYPVARKLRELFPDRVPSMLIENAMFRLYPRKPRKSQATWSKITIK
ncbi:uncharacterized protein IUM83_19074 [Phytophthora cinnamomi]|uniref:uncharacterized protein n=1 Tax=Phytophthora cinnamomi TaxID=4785 RepID=UPI003559BF49|nr:hypothetical protein IUM83_19074 [Phytophthora cinnamomi]